jgi:hypothetical protein
MIIEHIPGGLVQILCWLDQPPDIFHRFFQDRGKPFEFVGELLLGVFTGENREQG